MLVWLGQLHESHQKHRNTHDEAFHRKHSPSLWTCENKTAITEKKNGVYAVFLCSQNIGSNTFVRLFVLSGATAAAVFPLRIEFFMDHIFVYQRRSAALERSSNLGRQTTCSSETFLAVTYTNGCGLLASVLLSPAKSVAVNVVRCGFRMIFSTLASSNSRRRFSLAIEGR